LAAQCPPVVLVKPPIHKPPLLIAVPHFKRKCLICNVLVKSHFAKLV
jgi:hypothetical protein